MGHPRNRGRCKRIPACRPTSVKFKLRLGNEYDIKRFLRKFSWEKLKEDGKMPLDNCNKNGLNSIVYEPNGHMIE